MESSSYSIQNSNNNNKIPNEQLFKIHYMDSSKHVNKIITFSGNGEQHTLNDIFSEQTISSIELNNVDTIFSSQQIHKDDTIRNLKKKIISEIGTNVISYPEIYLYAKIKMDLSLFEMYSLITDNNKHTLDSDMLGQLLTNYDINLNIIKDIPIQDTYSYNDLLKYLNVLDKKQEIWIPIGPQFADNKINLLFQANPYKILNAANNPFQPNVNNPLLSFENNVLLSYGDLIDNTIYATSVSDVIKYATSINLDDEYIIPIYFPLLEKYEIYTGIQLENKKQELLIENEKLYTSNFEKNEKNMNLFYQVYNNGNPDEIKFSQNGIQRIEFTMHPSMKTKLPLENLFKNIHANKQIPFIKYNPGSRFEKIYRVYSEEITKTGEHIPYLSKSDIINYSKNIGKNLQITFVIQEKLNDRLIDIIVSINQNADIDIICDFSSKQLEVPRSVVTFKLPTYTELELFLNDKLNSKLDILNKYLHTLNYKLPTFSTFKHNSLEIITTHYKIWSPLEKDINLKDFSHMVTSIFDVYDVKNDSIKLAFKRVNNYTQMDSINRLITETYKKSNSEKEVINTLILNHGLSEQEALLEFTKYLNNFTRINGKYVNKHLDIAENPGFSVDIGRLKTGLILHIDILQINNIEYIDLLQIYFNSLLRISQNIGIHSLSQSTSSIQKQLSGKFSKTQEITVDNVILPSEKTINPIVQNNILNEDDDEDDEDDEDDDDDEDGIFFDDDDYEEDEDEDEEDDTLNYGGTKHSTIKELDPKKYMFDKLKLLEPEIILTQEMGHYKAYSRACPTNMMRQPIIVTDEEKQNIDKTHRNAYGYALRYGSDPNNKNWFICPRYWCLKTNKPLTKKQVDSGECEGNTFEFTEDNYHKNANDEYIHHSPGFLSDTTHPKYGVPCCFSKNWNSAQLSSRRDKWNITDDDVDEPKGENWQNVIDGVDTELKGIIDKRIVKKQTKKININEVKYFSKISLFDNPGTWVFLPKAVQLYFNIDYNNVMSSENSQLIKPDQKTVLLYTVERKYHQSFIGCIANIYATVNNYDKLKKPIPTISEMRNIIANSLTLDMFLQYHNGSLVSIFQPKRYMVSEDILNKHTDSIFYKSLDENIETQMDFYESTVASFERFLEYIRDDDSWIDYVYLWDVITSSNKNLFKNGINLIILSISDNDITDNVEIICPTNSYKSKFYDTNKDTLILVEQDGYYAIVSIYDNTDNKKSFKRISTFSKTNITKLPELQRIINTIQKTTNKYCKPLPSKPKEYKYKQNISAESIIDILQEHNYIIISQVSNYNSKIIGFIIKNTSENSNTIFIPSFPSSIIDDTDIPIIYMDDITWYDYETTKNALFDIHNKTNGKILCKPLLKVIEDNLIVGLLTETNQLLQVIPQENIIDDGINSIKSYGFQDYFNTDKTIQTTDEQDLERIEVIKNIHLETQFYSSFKTTIRILLNEPSNHNIREKIVEIINEPNYLYRIKLQKLEILLKFLLRNSISFDEIDENVLHSMKSVTDCTEYVENKSYCIVKNNNNHLIIPNQNLISGIDNEQLYFGRMADELVRYKRVQLFMLEPLKYLNIGTVDYNVNNDEVILLQSVLTDDYWNNLQPFQTNKYIHNLNYDIANPNITQRYSSEITHTESDFTDNINNESNNLCIKEELPDVIGNIKSEWKQAFPIGSKEIVFNCSNTCSFNIIQTIYDKHFDTQITITQIKQILISEYNKYMENHKSKILHILRKQNGKDKMINAVEKNNMTLETLIISEDYYLTTLDIWVLASYFKLPIMLFSQSNLENLNLQVNWIILSGNIEKDKFFFIRSPATSRKCPEHHMIIPERPLYDLDGFSDKLKEPEKYINNNLEFSSYLQEVLLHFE